jgi:hypothetical protein
MTLASLPTLDTWIAFNPLANSGTLLGSPQQALPASGASNTYWTNVSKYVRDFTTNSGKQHYLDRVESGTLRMTVNNRDGFFTNGTTNGTGYVLDSRCPIAMVLTWSGTGYPAYFGLTDQILEVISDNTGLNSDLTIQASDLIKQLSLKYMASTSFWEGYAQSTSAANWYRCDATQTAVITAATGNGTTVTYTAFNNFSSGQNITITGLQTASGATLNLVNVVIASVSSTGFTVTNSANGISSGTGAAYRTAIIDQIGSNNGNYIGPVSFPTYGAMIYDADGCVDVANGGTTATGYVRLPDFAGTQGAIDFWVLGQGIANSEFTIVQSTGSVQCVLSCSATGFLQVVVLTVGTVTSTVKIDDGFWHHIGLVSNSSGILTLYADGQFFTGSALSGLTGWTSVTGVNTQIPASVGGLAPGAYYDEIVVSTASHLTGLQSEVKSRYRAGTMLQLPTNPSQSNVLSGDRIAEILTVAGFGDIVNGAIVLNTNQYFINNGSAWVNGTSGNGFIDVEPYYWDTPVTTSTALDLIGEIQDTDIGNFFQKPDGTFAYFNQNFYGSWSWSGTSGTWTPSYTTPSGDHIWTDDTTSTYHYYGPTTQLIRDDADTWTMVQVTPQAGTMETYENVSAEARYGYSTLTKSSTLHPTLNLALSTAYFLGYLFRSPLPRVGAVELRSETANGANMTALIGSKLGDPVNFVRTMPNASTSGTYPAQRGQVNANMVIESIQLDFVAKPGYLHATFTLSPYELRT